jgi:DNA-binding beta-propeller fold protein YncE
LKSSLAALPLLVLATLGLILAQSALQQGQESLQLRQVPLPTSKFLIGPSPGVLGSLNGFTPTVALSPDKRYAAFLNDGYGSQRNKAHQSIAILDLSTNQIADFPDERLGENAHQSYFIGLAFSSDGSRLYASMGSITDPTGEKAGDTGNGIAVYSFRDGKVAPERFIKIPPQKIASGKEVAYGLRKTPAGTAIPYPAGFSVIPGKDGRGDKLLIANNYSDNIVLLDSANGHILKSIDVSEHEIIPSEFPYTCVAARDGIRAWCSLWNASRVVMINLELGHVVRSIPLASPTKPTDPGSHPTALLLSPDEKELFVALSNADRVEMVDVGWGPNRPLSTGYAAGVQERSLESAGSCPDGLALSGDGSKLFVADACLNAVAVYDVAAIRNSPIRVMPTYMPIGFIPTDWYPTALATVGDDLLIATSKGQGTGPNNFPGKTNYEVRHEAHAYIATLLYGSVARVNFRDIEKQLPELTKRVEQNNRINLDPGSLQFAQGTNPIKHVIYIIKENRTYDQVLGDLKVGNGDPSLTLYGADVTPNEHKLALQFGVLDNFYDSGEVSGDGHEWSTAGITSDYNEKTWQINYRSKERTYDFQGTVADELPLENNEPDVDAPATGYIWDNLAAHGVSYRDYGEFVTTIWCKPERVASPKEGTPSAFSVKCPQAETAKGEALPSNVGQPHGSASPWPWPVPRMNGTKPTRAVLRDHFDPNFPDFNTDYPDQLRADEFLNEFDGFARARADGKGTQLPAFVLLYLPDDHTHGTTPGHPRPAASVADNDLALGRVVEAVSRSSYWDDTAIFVLEDDAQNGADHVDAHRSIAFVISKYSPGSSDQPFVERHFYTTVSTIHTMEALLGLPPMNQNDAYAPVMSYMFSGPGNQPPFTADWSNRDNGSLYQLNPPKGQGAQESSEMDFSRPDAANAEVLNAILWRDRKGNALMPAAKHTILTGGPEHERDRD